ncbi:M23 family metallopeptidase [Tsukamurella soli]|uniref:M23 family metallopeptidase n=1 Tax=Tsukamurella soli TaxID=644556 RepID=A0ABP8JEX2_9ACTN
MATTRILPLVVSVAVVSASVLAGVPGAQATAGAYDWPLDPRPEVVTGFTPPTQRWESGHRGVDLAATPGQAVYAAGPGTVHFAGVVDGRTVVSVLHPNGLLTTYEPLAETAVRAGDAVTVGAPIGTVAPGHPGCPREVCLHWGLRKGSGHSARYYDPRLLVGAGAVRLLPLGSPQRSG